MAAEAFTEAECYWLGHCEGFRVDAPGGKLGVVKAVLHRRDDRSPDALVVRAGLLGRTLVVVPATSVDLVEPRRQRVRLVSPPTVGDETFLDDLIRRLDAAEEPVVSRS